MIKHKSFWSDALVYTVGLLFVRSISFLLLPLHTNLLNPEVLGFVFLLLTLLAFLNTFFNHGMNSALLKFFHENNFKEVVSTSFLYSIFTSFIFIGILIALKDLLFASFISKFSPLFFALLISSILFFDMLSNRALNILRMTNKKYYFLFICLTNVVVSLALNIILIRNLNLGFDGALLSIVGTAMVQCVFLLPIILFYVKLYYFNFSTLLKMIKFALPLFPSAVFLITIELSDRWMLKWLDGVYSVGLYGAGYKIATLVLIIVNSFNLSWQPYYLKNSNKKYYESFMSIGTSFLLILLFLCTLLSAAYPHIVEFSILGKHIINPRFWAGAAIIPIIAFSYFFYGLFVLQMPSVYLKNKQNWVPAFWGCGLIVNVLFNLYLIPKFSFFGAAFATFLSYLSMSIFIVYKNSLWMPLKYSQKPIVELLIMSSFFLLICFNLSLSLFLFCLLLILYCWRSLVVIKNYFVLPK